MNFNKNFLIKLIIALFLCSLSISSFAAHRHHSVTQTPRLVFSIGGGQAIAPNVGTSKTFPIVDPTTDEQYTYTINQSSQNVGLFDVFLGGEWQLNPSWALQVGLDYNQERPFSANGMLSQGADPESTDNYAYSYTISTKQLLIQGKLLYTCFEKFHPYISAGLGTAFNQAYNYSTTIPAFTTFTRMYGDYSTTSFSYSLGLGIDTDLTSHLRFGIGYRFANVGKVKLGNAVIDTTPVGGTLSQSNFRSNEWLAQVTILV